MEAQDEGEVSLVRPFAVTSYVPRHIVTSPLFSEGLKPQTEKITAAMLFLDVSGFTKLSETLQTMGSHGIELLTNHLNLYFGTLINYIDEHGGDVIKIAGDAMIVIWKIQDEPQDNMHLNKYIHETMTAAIIKIVNASIKCIKHNQSYKIVTNRAKTGNFSKFSSKISTTLEPEPREGSLRIHCAIVCGVLTGIHCGGVSDCWEFILTNPALFDEMNQALTCAGPNEIALGPSASILVDTKALFENDSVKVSMSASGTSKLTVLHPPQAHIPNPGILELNKVNDMEDSTWDFVEGGPSPESNQHNIHFSKFKAWVESCLIEGTPLKRMLDYAQHVVKARLLGGHSSCVAELRKCSILFINLTNMKYDGESSSPVQKIITAVQGVVFSSEGFIRQFIVDDKGTVIIVAYGVPGMSHEDDCYRCAMASLEIKKKLYDIGIEASMGMTTGRVYCGDVGNRIRREYALVGDTVNTAAHLMSKRLGILCDQDTYNQLSSAFEFEKIENVKLKGKADGFRVYKLLEDKTCSHLPSSTTHLTYIGRAKPPSERSELVDVNEDFILVGRENEMEAIERALIQFKGDSSSQKTGSGILIHIHGDAGVGKTSLVLHINKLAKKYHGCSGFGQLVQGSENIPFCGWVDYMTNTISELSGSTPESRKQFFSELLDKLRQPVKSQAMESGESDTEAPRTFLPIFSDVFEFECPENAVSQSMTKEQRQNCLRRLLCRVFKSSHTFLICILEQVQWVDDASWELLFDVVKSVPNMQVIITCRSEFLDTVKQKVRSRLNKEESLEISLPALDRNQTEAVVCNILKSPKVPPELTDLLYSRTQGVPLLIEETMRYLIRNKYVEVVESECVINNSHNLTDIPFPDNIEGLIVQRFDELDSHTSLLMKVASVIGNTFTLSQVSSIYPIKKSIPLIEHMLVLCMKKELIICVSKSRRTYSYKLDVIRQVAYNMLLQRQRKWMHLAFAQNLEKEYGRDMTPKTSAIAHHYEMAEKYAKNYYGIAAANSHSYSAYDECTKLLQKALSLAASHQITIKRLTSVKWGVMMAESLLHERKFEEAELEYKNILSELNIDTVEKSQRMTCNPVGSFWAWLGCQNYLQMSQLKKERDISMENLVGNTPRRQVDIMSIPRSTSMSTEAWSESHQDLDENDNGGKGTEANCLGEDDDGEVFSIVISTCFYKLSWILLEKREMTRALIFAMKAMSYRDAAALSIEYLLPESFSAIIHIVMGRKDAAVLISKKVLDTLESSEYKEKETRSSSNIYSNIALASLMMGALSSAKNCYTMGLVRLSDTKSSLQHEWISNLCVIHSITGDIVLVSKYVKQLARDLTQRSDLQLVFLLRIMELILYHRSGMGSLETIKSGLEYFITHSTRQRASNTLEQQIVEFLLACLSENIESMEQILRGLSVCGTMTPIIIIAESFCLYTLLKLLISEKIPHSKPTERSQKISSLFIFCQKQAKERCRYFAFFEKTIKRMEAYHELSLGNNRHSESMFSRIVRETSDTKEFGFDRISASFELKRTFKHQIDDSVFKVQFSGNISKKNVETFDFSAFFLTSPVLF